MSTEMQEFPDEGEIVVVTVTKIGDHGAYVGLDEYNSIQGFLHISEIAPGWVRNVRKYVTEGEKKVVLVKKIRKDKGEIDLSLRQISKDQQKKKLLDVKRHEKGKGIIKNIQDKAKLSDKQIEELEDKIFSKYDSVYDAVIDIGTNGIKVFDEFGLPRETLDVIEEVSSKIKLPSVEIRGILEISDISFNGIENIKKQLQDAEQKGGVEILYIGAPKYRMSVRAPDFKSAERTLKPILEDLQKNIEKNKGTFVFTREESKKTRGD